MISKLTFQILFLMFVIAVHDGAASNVQVETIKGVSVWLSSPDQSKLLTPQVLKNIPANDTDTSLQITIDDSKVFQQMDGFGFTLTGGSARLIHQMGDVQRAGLLSELFSSEAGIGINYLRLSVGGSDLSDSAFTYLDLPENQSDVHLTKFNLAPDEKHLIPLLHEILGINPELKLMGSPWSAPAWMKDNGSLKGGSLKPEYYAVYAAYLIKYIETLAEVGITIDALTVQNEPLHPGNNPSMYMTAGDQKLFVKNYLGPAFNAAGINTKIVIYDHNADRIDYPISILNDPEAKKYIDGSAFHLYGGEIEALAKVHEAHPDKNIYFTEQWIGAPADFGGDLQWHIKNLIIGATRNWCKTVLEWNLAADQNQDPHTDSGGCTRCLGAITVNGNSIERNPAYYIIGHASKFVASGSVRIASNIPQNLPNVAFKTPKGEIVVVVLNESEKQENISLVCRGKKVSSILNAGVVATYVFPEEL